jgi:hypothetical protein
VGCERHSLLGAATVLTKACLIDRSFIFDQRLYALEDQKFEDHAEQTNWAVVCWIGAISLRFQYVDHFEQVTIHMFFVACPQFSRNSDENKHLKLEMECQFLLIFLHEMFSSQTFDTEPVMSFPFDFLGVIFLQNI